MSDRWIFGYGSLVWRPAISYVEQRQGYVEGWQRRFWQGSPDHRGTPEAPGRVVTAVAAPGARLWGVAYRVAARDAPAVFGALDHREKGGYERHDVAVMAPDADEARDPRSVTATMYVARPDNPNFLGPAPLDEMAEHVLRSEGPSGPNVEYVLRLAEALRAMPVDRGEPTFALEARIHVKMRGA